MPHLLLQELSNQVIDWLLTAGKPIKITSSTLLLHPEQSLETLYILLEGALNISLADSETEIEQLSPGAIIGSMPGLDTDWQLTTVRAMSDCWVLAVPRSLLTLKFNDDPIFAARLYRISAMLLANRLAQLTQQLTQQSNPNIVINRPQRDSITLFAVLQDDDLDWLIAVGQLQQVPAETILRQGGRPGDAFHILLEGAVAFSPITEMNPIRAAFTDSPANQSDQEVARLSRGDTIGEMMFINADSTAMTARVVREAQILSVPRWRLAAKLLHDPGFAARFYQVLALLLTNRYQTVVQQWVDLNIAANHLGEREFDSQFLTRVALAEARFEWMLKRIQSKTTVGGGMKW